MGNHLTPRLQATAKAHNIKLTGKMEECLAFHQAKLLRKPLPKSSPHETSVVGHTLITDVSHPIAGSLGGARYWALTMDRGSRYKWTTFLHSKSDLPKAILKIVRQIEQRKMQVKKIQCDHAGENTRIKDLLLQNGVQEVEMTYSSPYTPQKNGAIERDFNYLYDCVRSLLNQAVLVDNLRTQLWAEAANHSTDLDNILVRMNGRSDDEMFLGKPRTLGSRMSVFGEIEIIRNIERKKK